jgi:hypothetical protein
MGRNLAEGLISKLGAPPDAAWLFCSPGDQMDLMVKGVHEAIGGCNLIGCTTAGEISSSGFSTGSVVLGGIVSDQIEFEFVSVSRIGRDSEAAGRKLAAAFTNGIRYVQLFSDGTTGNGCAILRGMDSVFKAAVPVSGGTAGDSGKFLKTWQFINGQVQSDSAVAIGFRGEFKLGTGVCSGWEPIGLPKKVTRSRENVLYELNGESALNVYERFLGKHAKNLPAVGVEYPLGLMDPTSEPSNGNPLLLRATMSVNREERSIRFAGELPQDAMVQFTCGDRSTLLDATDRAVDSALGDLGTDSQPAVVFFYSCMARKILLGLRTKEEFERVRARIDASVPCIGFYSYGEYCRTGRGEPNRLHNETATLSVFGA